MLVECEAAVAVSQLPKVVLGVKFADGIEVAKEQVQTAA